MTKEAPLAANERTAAVAYIADMTGGLALIARRHGLHTLGYLLDMARLEAENLKGTDGPLR
ncbi:MAG: hypothetical protein AB7V13_07080 [Pseudorhodoplanes sp.]|uniref:hypothetical protein n=1 Tax=Pseudorhodoplanes sp. TaxID=1934341 RepID=UPI003D10BFDC